MRDLKQIRVDIDCVDAEVIKLLKQRFELTDEVGRYKRRHHLPTIDPSRFQQLLGNQIAEGRKAGLPSGLVRDIYETIHEYSVSEQDRTDHN